KMFALYFIILLICKKASELSLARFNDIIIFTLLFILISISCMNFSSKIRCHLLRSDIFFFSFFLNLHTYFVFLFIALITYSVRSIHSFLHAIRVLNFQGINKKPILSLFGP